jgi:hypothetical protein
MLDLLIIKQKPVVYLNQEVLQILNNKLFVVLLHRIYLVGSCI